LAFIGEKVDEAIDQGDPLVSIARCSEPVLQQVSDVPSEHVWRVRIVDQ
jgi:hypothetical protein